MPVFLLPLLSALGSPLGRKIGLALVAVAALGIAIWRVDAHGYNRAVAEEKAATAAEHDRRVKAEEIAQQAAAEMVNNYTNWKIENATLQAESTRASAANNGVSCLPANAVDRLRRVQPDRRPAGK